MSLIDQVLLWWPILWLLRAFIGILLVGVGWSLLLYFSRFVRVRNVKAMWNAGPPKVSGSVNVPILGGSAALKLDHTQDEQVLAVDARLKEVERAQELQGQAVGAIARRVFKEELGNGELDS